MNQVLGLLTTSHQSTWLASQICPDTQVLRRSMNGSVSYIQSDRLAIYDYTNS